MPSNYQVFAEQCADALTKTFSASSGKILKFNGFAAGPNIFIEAANAATVRWAAIKNPIIGSKGYTAIRRSYLSGDPEPRFKLAFPITSFISKPELLPHAHISDALRVSFETVQELVDQNQIWVGQSPRRVPQNAQIVNIDSPANEEYQKDYDWVESPRFQKSYPHIVAGLSHVPRLG